MVDGRPCLILHAGLFCPESFFLESFLDPRLWLPLGIAGFKLSTYNGLRGPSLPYL